MVNGDVKEGRDERDRGDRRDERDSGDEEGCWVREGWEGRSA